MFTILARVSAPFYTSKTVCKKNSFLALPLGELSEGLRGQKVSLFLREGDRTCTVVEVKIFPFQLFSFLYSSRHPPSPCIFQMSLSYCTDTLQPFARLFSLSQFTAVYIHYYSPCVCAFPSKADCLRRFSKTLSVF